MKSYIDRNGDLTIEAETEAETYFLKEWRFSYGNGETNIFLKTPKEPIATISPFSDTHDFQLVERNE